MLLLPLMAAAHALWLPTMVSRPTEFNIKRGRLFLIGVILALVFSVSTITTLYTDLLWFREVGFSSVFWTVLGTKAALALMFGVAFFIFAFVNLMIVRRVIPEFRLSMVQDDPLERYRAAILPYFRTAAFVASATLAFFFALAVVPLWRDYLFFQNAVEFGSVDPLFSKDIGFYVFNLPVLRYVYSWGMSALILITLITAGAHYLTGGIRPQAAGARVTSAVKAHISALVGLIALLRAWGYRLDQLELLYSERGGITGASYTDVTAELPALRLLVVISIIAAALFLVNIRFRGWALPVAGLGLWLLISLLAAGLYPFLIQRFRVVPAQLQRETPYIQRNMDATRFAYGMGDIEVQTYPATPGVSRQAVDDNKVSINNLRLWDPDTIKTAYKQLQEIRPYYQFVDVDVDRYEIDGELRQIMLSPREIDITNLGEADTWQNQRLFYTHGYGAVASPTNATAEAGRPDFLVQDIPPVTDLDQLDAPQGGLYFGEAGSDYSIVRTDQEELDYPLEGDNKTGQYSGKAGVEISGLLRRMAYSIRFRDVNLLISGLVNSDSRIVYYRQIRERLQTAAPFMEWDGDPYLVIAEGRMFWMLDGYTASSMYPYSQRLNFAERSILRGPGSPAPSMRGTHNYIRNSVKATVDAFDGTVSLYVWDEEDPLIESWRRAFPDIFKPGDEMPEALRNHIRYPEDMFRIQSGMYQRYHMTNPDTFYQNEDLWVIPNDPTETSDPSSATGAELHPYYVLMKLPGAEEEEYVLILPMNPRNRPNMVSLMVAKSGPEDYGRLIDFRFPVNFQVFGVGQIHSRINSDENISRTITLLDQAGSNVILGNLLVLPIGDSILYFQPLFLQAEATPIPELKQVILASSDRVVMRPTLDQALEALLEGGPAAIPILPDDGESTDEERLETLRRLLQEAIDALQRGVDVIESPAPE
jgi:hypothetical protein